MPIPDFALTPHDLGRVGEDGGLHLADDKVGAGVGQVDLVERGDDGEARVHREEAVGDGLGLNALEGIDEQDRPLAGGEASRHLVVEVDVAGVSIRLSS